ncbi:ComEC/Rec2 family competence protein [Alteromonas macleodii]|uniref:ComEC/Rec2 family competence protein n=1 Tax=Alteromonas macleodii TaxID=28108 RepID=UPI0020768B88|nr:MBL fold metallo-hydrolase [Alteromonas macleodii]USI27908.1 MBL fold metallo-hydrolase [Alteromonas macleodii]
MQIHYINTGQGGSTLIIGPNGTSVLYDFGVKPGNLALVLYLHSTLPKQKQIDYAILSHRHKDHYFGYKDIVAANFDVRVANYEPDGPESDSSLLNSNWYEPATKTMAGKVRTIPVGLVVSLGDGATMHVVAANGHLLDGTRIKVKDENDRSIALFINYKNFQYLIDGDLGGGTENCSGHETTQVDVQTFVARTLLNSHLITSEDGLDAMHIAHHGSESSTPLRYVSLVKPQVGFVSVGNPNCKYRHPRRDVLSPLIEQSPRVTSLSDTQLSQCPKVERLKAVYQTDKGSETCNSMPLGKETLNAGLVSGDIVLTTDGERDFKVSTSGNLFINGKLSSVGPKLETIYCLDEYEPTREKGAGTCI